MNEQEMSGGQDATRHHDLPVRCRAFEWACALAPLPSGPLVLFGVLELQYALVLFCACPMALAILLGKGGLEVPGVRRMVRLTHGHMWQLYAIKTIETALFSFIVAGIALGVVKMF